MWTVYRIGANKLNQYRLEHHFFGQKVGQGNGCARKHHFLGQRQEYLIVIVRTFTNAGKDKTLLSHRYMSTTWQNISEKRLVLVVACSIMGSKAIPNERQHNEAISSDSNGDNGCHE